MDFHSLNPAMKFHSFNMNDWSCTRDSDAEFIRTPPRDQGRCPFPQSSDCAAVSTYGEGRIYKSNVSIKNNARLQSPSPHAGRGWGWGQE